MILFMFLVLEFHVPQELCIYTSHQIWKIVNHYFLKYFLFLPFYELTDTFPLFLELLFFSHFSFYLDSLAVFSNAIVFSSVISNLPLITSRAVFISHIKVFTLQVLSKWFL